MPLDQAEHKLDRVRSRDVAIAYRLFGKNPAGLLREVERWLRHMPLTQHA